MIDELKNDINNKFNNLEGINELDNCMRQLDFMIAKSKEKSIQNKFNDDSKNPQFYRSENENFYQIDNDKKKNMHGTNLIKSIKSFYITKFTLSYLQEKLKLNLFIYNKFFQNKLNLNIEYYKKSSGKYIIGEKNGKGKEYDSKTKALIYIGEYKNGKRNGIGKEYDNEYKLIFEGEYLNGKPWNGKIYDKTKNKYFIFS